MRTIVLYIYHIYEQRLSQISDLKLEPDLVDTENYNNYELIFAINDKGGMSSRIAIPSKPGVAYYDHYTYTYRVWFDTPDRDKAIEAIGNYILDHVASEIKTHRSFINRLKKEQAQAIELLESISEDVGE